MLVRKILYRKNKESDYEFYIDIGGCEKHYDIIPLYKENCHSYKEWYENILLREELGTQILILHYYLLQINNNDILPYELKIRLTKNLSLLNEFNKKWFDIYAPFFNSLDLNFESIEEEIKSYKEDENQIKTEVEFNDGSSIKFLDIDDNIKSFYVTEKEYKELSFEIKNILELLK